MQFWLGVCPSPILTDTRWRAIVDSRHTGHLRKQWHSSCIGPQQYTMNAINKREKDRDKAMELLLLYDVARCWEDNEILFYLATLCAASCAVPDSRWRETLLKGGMSSITWSLRDEWMICMPFRNESALVDRRSRSIDFFCTWSDCIRWSISFSHQQLLLTKDKMKHSGDIELPQLMLWGATEPSILCCSLVRHRPQKTKCSGNIYFKWCGTCGITNCSENNPGVQIQVDNYGNPCSLSYIKC